MQPRDLAHPHLRPGRGERLSRAGLPLQLGERPGGLPQERPHDQRAQDEQEPGDGMPDDTRLLDAAVGGRDRDLGDLAQGVAQLDMRGAHPIEQALPVDEDGREVLERAPVARPDLRERVRGPPFRRRLIDLVEELRHALAIRIDHPARELLAGVARVAPPRLVRVEETAVARGEVAAQADLLVDHPEEMLARERVDLGVATANVVSLVGGGDHLLRAEDRRRHPADQDPAHSGEEHCAYGPAGHSTGSRLKRASGRTSMITSTWCGTVRSSGTGSRAFLPYFLRKRSNRPFLSPPLRRISRRRISRSASTCPSERLSTRWNAAIARVSSPTCL